MILEYTRQQKRGFNGNSEYWAVFIGTQKTQAEFYGLYKVLGCVPDTIEAMPQNFPKPEWFQGENDYYNLEPVQEFQEYAERLVIDWGGSTVSWYQKGTNEKAIVSFAPQAEEPFPGYDKVVWSYDRMKEIVENPWQYATWQKALENVYAVYLIVDAVDGTLYVGSAYGMDGLLGRWRCYAQTKHGDNVQMQELLLRYPERYHDFQFSILQVFVKSGERDVLDAETQWKERLHTRNSANGMNGN